MNHSLSSIYRLIACLAVTHALWGSSFSTAAPPNLLVIQTDEHNFRTLGCYRDTLPKERALIWGPDAVVQTPAIDSIARRGALCTSFYATSPVCTPSRASFFTGFYPQNTGSPQNHKPLKSDMVTFAQWLQDRGYATGYAGKWHLDGSGKPQWGPKRQFGFADNRFMFNRGHWKNYEMVDGQPRVASRSDNGSPTYDVGDADEESFSTDWMTDRAIDFINEHKDEPFCYHLSLPDPHGPNTVRPPYDTMYENMAIRPPMTFSMTRQNPKWAKRSFGSASKFNPVLMQQYFGMVKCIDDNVARLLDALEQLNLTERTIVVFTADHGDLCFEHGRLNKGNPYEGSAKVPMIIAAPGIIPPGSQIDQAMGTVDFMPTILSLISQARDGDWQAGDGDWNLAENLQGRNAADLFRGKKDPSWNGVTILRSANQQASWVAAVSDRFKLVYSKQDQPWLFDLKTDPDELNNHFDDPQHAETIWRMTEELISYAKRYNEEGILSGHLQGLSPASRAVAQ